jgi:uncharacterized cupin superfamily protein
VVPEVPLRRTQYGLVADGDGWFVLNARESRWRDYGPLGIGCNFEGKRRFPQLGINVNVQEPGRSLGLYHRERAQEAFLVVAGECVLVVEGEEQPLGAWDFFHCPAGTAHVLVGAGDEPAIVIAVGARGGRRGITYLVDPAAAVYGATAVRETTKPEEAYATFPGSSRTEYRDGWLPDLRPGTARPRPRTGKNGWFVVNVRDAPWVHSDYFGSACVFEDEGDEFPELGFTLGVFRPGQPSGLYHHEANQEDFLVLAGECVLLVEGEERPVRAWDFVHCPAGTEHAFVGAGDGPCIVFMTGSRVGWPEKGIVYADSDLARRYGAGAEAETSSPAEAYAPFERWQPSEPLLGGMPWG